MLYLIKTFGRTKKQRALKVGFSDDINKRFSSYYHQNPFCETVSIREGDRYMETKLHLYLEALGYKQNFLNEWFLDLSEVIQRFHDTEDKMNKVIWKNRNTLFIERDFKTSGNSIKKRIYEDLRLVYYNDKYQTKIDKSWLKVGSVQLLKRMRESNPYM